MRTPNRIGWRAAGMGDARWAEGACARRRALDDVRVVQLLEQRHLTQSGARDALILALELDLLERGLLARVLVRGDVDLAERALAELLPALPKLERGRAVGAGHAGLPVGSKGLAWRVNSALSPSHLLTRVI